MKIRIKTTAPPGRAPTGRDLRVYAVGDDGKQVPIRGVDRVAFSVDGRTGKCTATLVIAAEVDVEADTEVNDADAVPEAVVGPEDTTGVGKSSAHRCAGHDHVFEKGSTICRCGEMLRGAADQRGMVRVGGG